MDAQIRRLVVAGTEQRDLKLLTDAYNRLKQNFQANLVQSKDSIGQDIYVLLAESALDFNENAIADECLQMFFSSSPVKSQFVGRAYLCQFRMYMPKKALDYESLNNAVPFLQKCLGFAAASTRYQFIVYNASVVYFNYVRPFLRDGFRKHLCPSFQQVVDTLRNIPDEQDHLWQAELLFELVRCYIDANILDKARSTSSQLLELCQTKRLPLISDVFQYLTVNGILENDRLFAFIPIDDSSSLFNRTLIDLATIHRKIRKNQTKTNLNDELKKIFDKILALPLRSALNASKLGKSLSVEEQQNTRSQNFLTSYEKHRLLIEAGRISLLLRCTDLTKVILDALGEIRFKEPEYLLEVRLLQAEYMVKNLGDQEELYNKSAVDTRLRAIELAEETLESLVRTGQDDLVQTGCINLWNLCLPLLQTNLRGKIRKALTTLVNVLDRIQSLNWALRSEAHFELAKTEEDIEQMDSAKNNLLKAREFDDQQIYAARIDLALERLRLRCELYKTPDNVDDRVGIIIEQAGKIPHGNKNKQRALLIDACILLARDAFQVVLDSENPNAIGKMRANPTAQLKGFAEHFEKCIQNTTHYERLIPETDQNKRLKLWADLTMMARRQEIWDVCRVAARFCLLHDNEQRRTAVNSNDRSSPSYLFQRDLVRILAEIHFIAGEAEIEFIRDRRIELFDTPIRPPMPTVPAAQRAQIQQESDDDWKHYCNWLQQLSIRACNHFATGAMIGQLLRESWLICRAGEYLWNYTRHLFYSNRLRLILEPLSTIFNAMRKIGHEREILLLVNLAVALPTAYITPLASSIEENRSPSNTDMATITVPNPSSSKKGNVKVEAAATPAVNGTAGGSPLGVRNEDLRTALDICEYALHQTNENVAKPRSVPIGDRQTLLQLWVTIKQHLQQSIRPSLNSVLGEEETNAASLNTLSRAVIAVDTLSRLETGWHEYRDPMGLKQTVSFVNQCTWIDSLIELQLWCRLGIIGNRANDIETTQYAREKTLQLITMFQTRKVEKFQLSLANEYVSRACAAHAECLLKQQTGQKQERKEILSILVEAASYSAKADLYELTMHIARHYWNTCRPSIKRRLERSILLDSLNELVHHINAVSPKSIVSSLGEREGKDEKTRLTESFRPKKQPLNGKKDSKTVPAEETPAAVTEQGSNPQEDAQIRSVLYGVLVQIYMDRHSWHTALDIIDNALQVLPRTQHRLLLYKYRVLIKSKLGLSISMDMQKFREQGELALARMWRQVALMAKRRDHVINGYQRCIETLQTFENYWHKIDYIFELASWLYSNEYLVDNVIDLIEWNIDLLLTSATAYQKRESLSTEEPTNQTIVLSSMRKSEDEGGMTTQKANAATESDQTPSSSVKFIIPNRVLPDLSIGEVTEVLRLEYLCRCHIFLAFITRRNQPEHDLLLQKAFWLLIRLWQRGLLDSIEINKDAETEATAAAEALTAAGESAKKQGQKGGPTSPIKKKPNPSLSTGKSIDRQIQSKPAGSFDTSMPKTAAEWATFVVNEDLLQIYAFPQAKARGLSKQTISKPLLSFYYLDMFVGLLRDFGYNHLALPALSLMRLISRNLVKSSSMHTYSLIRIQQVCQESNLLQPLQTVCQLARPFTIRDDDLAASRADMVAYTKLLAQQHEEEAQLESALGSSRLRSEVRSYGTSAYSSSMSRNQSVDAKSLIPDLPGHRQILNKLIGRNIWLQTANLLFELNFIQESKEILQEVLVQAQTFDDQTCEKRAYILLGQIALHEHRFDQAIDLAMQGQQVPIDEYEWSRSVSTIIEALRQDPNQDAYKQKKIRSLLETSIKRLHSIGQLHVNKIASIAHATSLLTSKNIEIEQEALLHQTGINTVEDKSIFYRLNGILQEYDLIFHDLLSLNQYHDACDIILSRIVPIWKRFARDCPTPDERKNYLCQGLIILEQLSELLAERWRAIRTVTSSSDLVSIQLPIQRQFLRVQTERIAILLDLLKIYANELFDERVRRKITDPNHLAVEDFVKQNDSSRSVWSQSKHKNTSQWEEMIKTLPEKLIASMMSVFEMITTTDKSTKAKILFYLAETYFILGQNTGTDYPLEWNSQVKEIISKLNEIIPEKVPGKRIESRGSAGISQASATVDIDWMTDESTAEFNRQKIELHQSMSFLTQSTEFALQSLSIALSNQDKPLIQQLSLLLCNTIGQFDPVSSIIFLSLSQTATASIYTENVLRKACRNPNDSELASLFTLLDRIRRNETVTNSTNGLVYRTVMDRLKNYWPYKYMAIRNQYYELTKDMPSCFNFLILHYSSDTEILYASLFNSKMSSMKFIPGTGAAKQPGNKTASIIPGFAYPQIMKIPVKKQKLMNMIDQYERWKEEYSQMLQRYELKLQHSRDKQAMLNSEQVMKLLKNIKEEPIKIPVQPDHVDLFHIDGMKERFLEEILPGFDQFFSVLTPLLANYLESDKQFEARPMLSNDHLILLVDPFLAHLPLDSMEIFKHVQISGISRDFSIQSVFNRLNANISLDDTAPVPEAEKSKKVPTKDAPSEIVSELQPIDPNNTYTIIEPILLKTLADNKSATPFDSLRQKCPQLMGKWKTMKQEGSVTNTVELERLVTDAQGVIYFGAHTISELVGFHRCPTLSKNGCTIICSFDRTSTNLFTSSSPLAENDLNAIKLDRSTETALLWSSGGVKSIVLNQWKSAMTDNDTAFMNTFTDIAALRCSISQALRLYVYPYFRPVEIDPANAAVTTKDSKGKVTAGGNKKTRSPSPKSKPQSSAITDTSSKKKGTAPSQRSEVNTNVTGPTEPIVEIERPTLELQQLNLAIFGLPNLTFNP